MVSLSGFLNLYPDHDWRIDDVIEKYEQWLFEDKYMILSRLKPQWEGGGMECIALKCAKRGNDVYVDRVHQRFNLLRRVLYDLGHGINKNTNTTNVLYVTLTYDSSISSMHHAWQTFAKDFNKFMAYIRRAFGSVYSVRCFESFANGYPHAHIMLFFNDFSFKWKMLFSKTKNRFIPRIHYHFKQFISSFWHSHVDISACRSVSHGYNYLSKYVEKSASYNKRDTNGLKTLALCWGFRKKAYSVSRYLLLDLKRTLLHYSNKKITAQTDIYGKFLEEPSWSLLGFVPSLVLGLETWFSRLNRSQILDVDEYLSNVKKKFGDD
jgi:hypothetical protein